MAEEEEVTALRLEELKASQEALERLRSTSDVLVSRAKETEGAKGKKVGKGDRIDKEK